MITTINGIINSKLVKKLEDSGLKKFFKLMIVQDMRGHRLGFMLITKVFGKIPHQHLYPEENTLKEVIIM